MGNLVFQATLGGQVNLVGPNTASTYNLNVPAVSSTISTTSGTETLTNKTLTTPVINGFTGDTSVVNIGSGQFYKDTAGNLGLGVTPSAWGSAYKMFQAGTGASFGSTSSITIIGQNYYNDGSSKYIGTGNATLYLQQSGQHQFYTAGSGTAGAAISFTQAMTLDASGNLLVGTTLSPTTNNGKEISLNSTYNRVGYLSDDSSHLGYFQAYDGSGFTNLYNTYTSGGLRFFTGTSGGTERARIDSSGNLLVGTNSTSTTNGGAQLLPNGGNSYAALAHNSGSGSGSYYSAFYYNGSIIGTITQNGTTAVAYNTSSDYRLKNDIAPMTGALAKVALLKPCTYKWNADGSDGEGFIAHELAEVCPHAVTGEKDAVDEDGNPKYQGIDTSFLVATLTAALQELKAIVDAQAAEIAALKG